MITIEIKSIYNFILIKVYNYLNNEQSRNWTSFSQLRQILLQRTTFTVRSTCPFIFWVAQIWTEIEHYQKMTFFQIKLQLTLYLKDDIQSIIATHRYVYAKPNHFCEIIITTCINNTENWIWTNVSILQGNRFTN